MAENQSELTEIPTDVPPLETAPPPRPRSSISELIGSLKGGKSDPLSTIIIMAEVRRMERDEERYQWERDKRNEPPPPSINVEDLVSASVSKALEEHKKLYPLTPPAPQGPSEIEKEVLKRLKSIETKFSQDEQEKRDRKLINDATQPVMLQLEKGREERERLEKTIEDLKPTTSSTPPPSAFDSYLDMRTKLKNANLISEPAPGSVVFGKEGIPVSGSVPAWAVYAPAVIDKVFEGIETRLDRIVNKFGFGVKTPPQTTPPLPSRSLINLPEKPAFPPLTPVETSPLPVEESKTPKIEEKIVEPVKEPIEEPAKTLVKLPEKPKIEEAPQEAETLVKLPEKPIEEKTPETPAPAVAKPKIEVKPPVKPPDEEKPFEEKTVNIPEPAEPEKGYSKRELEKMKMPQIWKICNDLGIHRGGKKVELIDKILAKKVEEE